MEGDLKGYLKGDLKGDFEVDFRGDFKQDLEGDLLSSSGQQRSRSGLVQVWFSIELTFNSFELDSEVGRLVSHSNYFGKINPSYAMLTKNQKAVSGSHAGQRSYSLTT